MELNELSLKLKDELVRMLTRNPQNLDKEYFVTNHKVYTKREVAEEIKAETKLGIEILTGMVHLAIDITSRHKS